jgi:hypothetical protein
MATLAGTFSEIGYPTAFCPPFSGIPDLVFESFLVFCLLSFGQIREDFLI